jgi:hypothetical protein
MEYLAPFIYQRQFLTRYRTRDPLLPYSSPGQLDVEEQYI